MNTQTKTRNAIEAFLENWDRHQWMQDHGKWASAQWDEERAAYDGAVEELRAAVESLPAADKADGDLDGVSAALEAVREAAKSLADQVCPDESDYTATGTIDPADAKSSAEDLGIGECSREWECREGWGAYRVGDALYVRWYRDAWGVRHDRDLWVLVDDAFFA